MYYKALNINGVEYRIAVNITGSGAPTAETEGVVGMFYMDEDTGEVYKCLGGGEWLPFSSGRTSTARIADVRLYASDWVGDTSPYSQVVSVDGVTENSQVDLTPSVEQLTIFYNKDLAFVTENDGGVVTVYAIGQKPANDYIIQATVTEVSV